MKNKFIISTTNNIEGGNIKKYIDVICSNVVIGTNIFSDFAASFTDFFGGKSNSYKRKLEIIYNEAVKDLKLKAKNLGANALIGVSTDFDEISGKDKSMFMVSVSGTACLIEYTEEIEVESKNEFISQFDLDKEIQRKYIIEEINKDSSIKEEWKEFLFENPQIEIVDNLIDRFISFYHDYYSHKGIMTFIIQYLSSLPKNEIICNVYDKYQNHNKEVKDIIFGCNLFDANKILGLCENNIHGAILLLSSQKDYYDKSDIESMRNISKMLSELPDIGKVEIVKGGLLSKDQEKYICPNGHKNPIDTKFCPYCGLNIKGLTQEETDIIDIFNNRTTVLERMLQ